MDMENCFLSHLMLFQVKKMLDLHKIQVEDQKVKDMTATDESAEEDLRETKRTATIGSSGDVEGSTLQTVVSRKVAEGECSTVDLKSVKMVEANAGNSTIIVIIIESSRHKTVCIR